MKIKIEISTDCPSFRNNYDNELSAALHSAGSKVYMKRNSLNAVEGEEWSASIEDSMGQMVGTIVVVKE